MTTTKLNQFSAQVGDIYVCSWRYGQKTNVDFYEVVGVTSSGKSVKLRKVHKSFVYRGEFTDLVSPCKGMYAEESPILTRRLDDYGYVKIEDFERAKLWDGKPMHQTSQFVGH